MDATLMEKAEQWHRLKEHAKAVLRDGRTRNNFLMNISDDELPIARRAWQFCYREYESQNKDLA